MNREFVLKILVLVFAGFALEACSDADWENAMTYLPLERGHRAEQKEASTETASIASPPVVPELKAIPAPEAPQVPPASSEARAPQPLPVSVAAVSVPSMNKHCGALATQRASDVQFMDMNGATQRQVYERTYADCIAWDAVHR